MTLADWVHFHSLTWAEFGALVDCHPTWASKVVSGYPCSKELAARIHAVTKIWPTVGRGRDWLKNSDDGTMHALAALITSGVPTERIMTLMGYKNRASTRAMISKAKRRMRVERSANTDIDRQDNAQSSL